MRGLICDVLQDRDGTNCSNGGISSKFNRVLLVGPGVAEIFDPSDDIPTVLLLSRRGYLSVVPEEGKDTKAAGWMMGGQFIWSCDSRFPNDYPIPLFDRQEWGGGYGD